LEKTKKKRSRVGICLFATPMDRIGTLDDIIKAMVSFALDDGSYTTGIELFVHGDIRQI
jgi:hypothetical protein